MMSNSDSSCDRLWRLPSAGLVLSSDEVHILRTSLDVTASYLQSLQRTLSTDERYRAERFKFEKDRKHFIAARGVLRAILSQYLDIEAGLLRFCYSFYGKPALVTLSGQKTLSFNVSHSHGLALYAVTREWKIGVDLERICEKVAYEQIASQLFSPGEWSVFEALPAKMKSLAFFNCWTRKEAYIKARGDGFSFPLNQFDVSLIPGEPAKLRNVRGDPQEAPRWSLQEFIPGPGYVATLAVLGHGWQLKCWQWPGSQVEGNYPWKK